jgi:hypothetical protein
MEEVGNYALRGLVGRFGYWAMGEKDIHAWVEVNWGPLLGYLPETFILMKGWLCFLFKNTEDAELVLRKVWVVNKGSLMLKRWHLVFNLEKEHIRFRHLWVLFPGCSLALWSLEAFKEIENSLGKFLHVDPKHLVGSDQRMGKILVEIDVNEGLPAEIDIDWRGYLIQQRLDYVGIPFRCFGCKETGHLRYQCSGELMHKASFGEGVVKLVSNEKSTELEAWSDSYTPRRWITTLIW